MHHLSLPALVCPPRAVCSFSAMPQAFKIDFRAYEKYKGKM